MPLPPPRLFTSNLHLAGASHPPNPSSVVKDQSAHPGAAFTFPFLSFPSPSFHTITYLHFLSMGPRPHRGPDKRRQPPCLRTFRRVCPRRVLQTPLRLFKVSIADEGHQVAGMQQQVSSLLRQTHGLVKIMRPHTEKLLSAARTAFRLPSLATALAMCVSDSRIAPNGLLAPPTIFNRFNANGFRGSRMANESSGNSVANRVPAPSFNSSCRPSKTPSQGPSICL